MEEKDINKRIGEEVRMLRLSRNLSQEALADELKISTSTLSNLERGQTEFTVSRLYKVLSFLDITVFEFFSKIHKEELSSNGGLLEEEPLVYSNFNSRTERLEAEIRHIKAALEQLKNK